MPRADNCNSSSSKHIDSPPLRRYTACHQCRKRKMKCDTKRPCTTCIRSHGYAIRLAASSDDQIPPLDCTYDDNGEPTHYYEQARIEELEAKIDSLEAALRKADLISTRELQDPSDVSLLPGRDHTDKGVPLPENGTASPPTAGLGSTTLLPTTTGSHPSTSAPPPVTNTPFPGYTTARAYAMRLEHHDKYRQTQGLPQVQAVSGSATEVLMDSLDGSPLHPNDPLVPLGWPTYVPQPPLLNHLVETFFDCQPHAGRLLHRNLFTASLNQPPSSKAFPLSALLHAICAAASLYTSVVNSPPPPDISDLPAEELWPQTRYKISSDQSFGDVHALWSNMTGLKAHEEGDRLLQVVQSKVILTWYYYTTGSIVNVWSLNGKAARAVLPMGLNVGPQFTILCHDRKTRTPSILPPARTTVEDEERRNLLWAIYLNGRLQSAETCWAGLVDEEDISQLLPLPDGLWNAGQEYPVSLRQRLHSSNVYTTHPTDITSPFSLLLKAVALLSKVRTFNVRFRDKYSGTAYEAEPRTCPAFVELDRTVVDFKTSWPKEYESPFNGKNVDPTLYLASLLPSVAIILLHDPHVDFTSPTCSSAPKMMAAVEVILASIYQLSSIAFDVLLLDHFSSFCWVMAGMTLVRVLKAKMVAKLHIEVIKVRAEIEVVKHILSRLGEKAVIGRRQLKLLIEFFDAEAGSQDRAVSDVPGSPSRQTKTVTELLYISQRAARPPSPSTTFDNIWQWQYWDTM